ncbi:MAG TPA: ArsB/NhaD family transporter, partial [Thermodesulfobacteriota bacterium]|nr:ArsB/NhaD family transporter [Thermodesulfobacteriota bacterium]
MIPFLIFHNKASRIQAIGLLLAISIFFPLSLFADQIPANPPALSSAPSDVLIVTGKITDVQGKPLKDGHLFFFLNGQKIDPEKTIITSKSGGFEWELALPSGRLSPSRVEIEVRKPSYKSSPRTRLERIVKAGRDEKGNTLFLAYQTIRLSRTVSPAFWIATLILLAVYALIAFEWMHRTLASLLGAALLLLITYTAGTFYPDYFVLSFEDALRAIDMNVIFLLMAMMIIVGVMKRTGVFQWMAYKSFQLAKGNIFALAAVLMFVTALTSAFLDNVTTMLLIIPVTIEIAVTLKVNPITLLLPEAFASNIGGTATLIGDPPNIMIGSYAKLTFVDFVQHLTFINLIGLAVSIVYFIYWHKKDYLKAQVSDVPRMISLLKEEYKITNAKLLVYCGIILGMTIFLFIIHGALHMEPSIAAMIGAAVLLVVSKVDIVEMLEHEIEWPTLIFFIMLFVVVAGAEEAGLIQVIADWVKGVAGGSLVAAILMVLWISALVSAIIDNIPFTATMLPIVAYLTQVIPGAQSGVLWWALSLGACLGGNG